MDTFFRTETTASAMLGPPGEDPDAKLLRLNREFTEQEAKRAALERQGSSGARARDCMVLCVPDSVL